MTKPATSSTAPPPTIPAPATPATPKTSSSPEMAPSAKPTTLRQMCRLPHLRRVPVPSAPRSKAPVRQTQMRLLHPQAVHHLCRRRPAQREAPQATFLPLRQEAPREALLQILAAALRRAPEIPPSLVSLLQLRASQSPLPSLTRPTKIHYLNQKAWVLMGAACNRIMVCNKSGPFTTSINMDIIQN